MSNVVVFSPAGKIRCLISTANTAGALRDFQTPNQSRPQAEPNKKHPSLSTL